MCASVSSPMIPLGPYDSLQVRLRFLCLNWVSWSLLRFLWPVSAPRTFTERLSCISGAPPGTSLRLSLSADSLCCFSPFNLSQTHRTIANQSAARASVCHGTIAVVKVSPWNLVRRLFNTDLVAKQFIIKCTLINEFILTNLSHFHLPSTDSDRRNAANEMLFAV